MMRIKLSEGQARELVEWRRDPTLKPAERDRVEMVALSESGWTVAQIAEHLGYAVETVRRLFRRFPTEGWASIRHELPGPAPDDKRRERIEMALDALLRQERTWTAAQLAEALAEQGIRLSTRQVRRYLGRVALWRRTKRSLKHKQNPDRVARAKDTLAFLANEHKQVG
jgi:putative transposase